MPERSVRRLDARSLRAIAHPLRMSIMDALKTDGPATSATLARRLGESTGTLSWHLRHLAEHGFIAEDTERGTKRERWWRLVPDSVSLDPTEVPEEAAALSLYMSEIVRQCYQRTEQFLKDDWTPEWQQASTLSDWQNMRLAPEQLAELNRELMELVNRYADQPQDPNAQPVSVQIQSFPRSAS